MSTRVHVIPAAVIGPALCMIAISGEHCMHWRFPLVDGGVSGLPIGCLGPSIMRGGGADQPPANHVQALMHLFLEIAIRPRFPHILRNNCYGFVTNNKKKQIREFTDCFVRLLEPYVSGIVRRGNTWKLCA